jgi:hypothetical protein
LGEDEEEGLLLGDVVARRSVVSPLASGVTKPSISVGSLLGFMSLPFDLMSFIEDYRVFGSIYL